MTNKISVELRCHLGVISLDERQRRGSISVYGNVLGIGLILSLLRELFLHSPLFAVLIRGNT